MSINSIPPVQPHYSFGERLLRCAVFQIGVAKGLIERILMWVCSAIAQCTLFPMLFENKRAEEGLRSYQNLGAEVEFLKPKDGMASIHTMLLRSDVLEQKIESFSAKWVKISPTGNNTSPCLLAIIPPENPSQQWHTFEKDLSKLKWPKRDITYNGKVVRAIVTCEDAYSIKESDYHKNLFMNANSASVSFIMLGVRAGFYLGCKQSIRFHDPRGTWKSSGIASEAGYYNDIMRVYEKARETHAANNIWVTSTCGGGPIAAYLKSKVHESGTNFVFENSYSDLYEDFVDPQDCITRSLAHRFKDGLKSRDIAPEHKPEETGFSVVKMWKDLRMSDIGKVMVVTVTNDQRLAPKVAERNIAMARRVNKITYHLSAKAEGPDPHSYRWERDRSAISQGLPFLFS